MKLESQVCSLELAKKLKELGVKQSSSMYWIHLLPKVIMVPRLKERRLRIDHWKLLCSHSIKRLTGNEVASAFTVAELGEMLPMFLDGNNVPFLAYRTFTTWNDTEGWSCAYCMPSGAGDYALHVADTEADARGKMLIYLIDNKLITL